MSSNVLADSVAVGAGGRTKRRRTWAMAAFVSFWNCGLANC